MLRVILISSFVLAVSGSALYMTKLSVDGRYDRLSQLQAEIKAAENRAIILEIITEKNQENIPSFPFFRVYTT